MQISTSERMAAVWRDYERYGGPADPTKAQPPTGRWTLAFCLIQHFGRFPWLLGTKAHAAGGMGWDPCLPEPGTADYEIIESVVLKAEEIIGNMPEPLDKRLHGYLHGHRVPTGMNAHWSSPLAAIDGSEELREGLIAKLKAATLESAKGT
jgi:hypothetical protein